MKDIDHNDPNQEWRYKKRRPRLNLGENFDGSKSTLEPWVEAEPGVQVHPARLKSYLKKRKEMFDKMK